MTDDEALITSTGGLCAPLVFASPLASTIPPFTALRGMNTLLTTKQLKKLRRREKRERKRRAKPITVTMTVGEYEDLLEAARWG